nr:MAG TPA: Baseplate wedge protein [Caudoviricetes sp.]
MADKEFTQICKEILGIGKRLEKIEPDELREIKASIERVNEAFNANKALFDESKNDFDGKYNKVAQIVVTFDTLKAQIEEVLKSGVINDDTKGLISTYSSKKIVDLLNEAKGVIDKKFSTIHKNGITPWSSTLEYPAGAISVLNGKLYQAKSENTNKNPSENKEIWSAFASKEWSEQTFLNKDDKIDAYTKQESNNKFALKTDFEVSKQENGYTKLPNGLIIQWGKVGKYPPNATKIKAALNFPIAFPNMCLTVASHINDTAVGDDAHASEANQNRNLYAKTNYITKRGFTYALYTPNESIDLGWEFHWIAIGY